MNNLEVDNSWELLTDTGKITFPTNVYVQEIGKNSVKLNHNKLAKQIKFGDKVEILTGYNNKLNTILTGYVTHIKPRVPLEISCEDQMWKLKQNTIKDSGRNQTVSGLMAKHFSEYKTDVLDVELGNYYIDNISGAKLLEQLKSDFGLYSFFRNDTLVVGKRYNRETANKVTFALDSKDIETDELEFRSKEQIQLTVKAISNNSDGSKTEIELGEPNGESRTLNFYNLSKAELKAAAQREMERLLYDGWRGKFTAFGEPFVRQGDIVTLSYEGESEKTGEYWVDAVRYTFGVDGYRQEIKLGSRT